MEFSDDIVHHRLRSNLLFVCRSTLLQEPFANFSLVRDFELVVVERNVVHLFQDLAPLFSSMWQHEFETELVPILTDTISHKGEKEFDPTHKTVEKPFALGLNLVDKVVERLFVTAN